MSSYRQILKSTSIIGGSSLINMAIGMVRTKFVAILLGPSGMGLVGVYTSINGMVNVVAGMGISTSGVRQIAEAHGTGDEDRVAHIVQTLRRIVWITGIIGMAMMIVGSVFLSNVSFGSPDHALAIAILGVTILLANISTGQSCILQGTRRISDLAKVSIIGAINGTVLSIPCYYLWGHKGIVPSLILISGATLITSWWYARRVRIEPVRIPWHESREAAYGLLRFGIPFMLATLLTSLTGYLIKIFLIREVGLDGVGIWLAAFNLSGMLISFVLNAMATDYYPRLTAVSHDNQLVNKSVNAQTEIALLLAVPGLAATIIFAPLVITIFYSGKFDAAVDVLRWFVYGVFGLVISWPLGFIMLAKGLGRIFFYSQIFSNLFHLAAIWACTKLWGLAGTGIAYMLLYLVYTIMVYAIGYVVGHVTWSRHNWAHILLFVVLLVILGVVSSFVNNLLYQYTINVFLLIGISIYCFRKLVKGAGIGIRDIIAKYSARTNPIK